ncbi:MAG: GGDEF domain-containing protein [Sedimentibacter sp.]|uniref:GGDEF domain-containing protein n=1 Tax=Sedimentibacter sp. TaxID=1960295 RepID=UPI0029826762|nr:GGDEF domain-containing protein [Sedimentibacter sp.]MDW5300052.1 GGDEF domain-containing protein [Sedimentibacter sp.]
MMIFKNYISDALIKFKIIREKSGKIDLEVLWSNEQIKSIMGMNEYDIINKKITALFPGMHNSLFDWPKILSEAAMTNNHKVIEQYVSTFEKYLRLSIFGYKDDCFYIAIQDLTYKKTFRRTLLEKDREIKHLGSELKARANEDVLTKLYNLQFVVECIRNSILCYKEEGVNFCLLLIDIDDFNKINLEHGINTGDILLQDVAHILSSVARKIDVVGRYGNDKFIILLNNMDIDIAKISAGRIKMEIEKYDLNLVNGISICGALLEYSGELLEELMENAELLLSKAQSMGKGILLS